MTVTYSLNVANANLTGFGKLLLRWKGSIYKLLYREMILFVGLYYCLSLIYRYTLNVDQRIQFEKLAIYCEAFTNMVPLTFVLGFYVSIVVTRWWQQFMYIPWPDKCIMLIAANVHGADERGRMVRRTLARYLLLLMTLTCQAVSTSVRKRFPTLDHIEEAGIMTKEERLIFDQVPGSHGKWWAPTMWFTTTAVRARKEGRIKDDILLSQILDELHVYRNCCGMMFAYDWISIPLVYTQTVTIATYTYFIATVMGRQYLDPSKGYAKHEVDLYVPLFTIFEFFFFMGWLKVAEQLINPYGEDDDDFELNWCLDRNLIVSFFVVDDMYNMHPKLQKDLYWDEFEPVLPYTKSAFATRNLGASRPHHGSTMNLEIQPEELDFVPMETIQEEENFGTVYSSPNMSARGDPEAMISSTFLSPPNVINKEQEDNVSQGGLFMRTLIPDTIKGSRLLNMIIGQSNSSLNVKDAGRHPSLEKGHQAAPSGNINPPFLLRTPRKRYKTFTLGDRHLTHSSVHVSQLGRNAGGWGANESDREPDLPTAPVILTTENSRMGTPVTDRKYPMGRADSSASAVSNMLPRYPNENGFRFPTTFNPTNLQKRYMAGVGSSNMEPESETSSRRGSGHTDLELDQRGRCSSRTSSNMRVSVTDSCDLMEPDLTPIVFVDDRGGSLNSASSSLIEREMKIMGNPATSVKEEDDEEEEERDGSGERLIKQLNSPSLEKELDSSDDSLNPFESNQSTVRSYAELLKKEKTFSPKS